MKLCDINIRDPFILPYEGKYYLYGSRVGLPQGKLFNGLQDGIDVYVSSDLEKWTEAKPVFEANEGFWGKYQFWAPEVHIYRGRFYMFASFKADGRCRGTHILASDTPDGRFTPVSEVQQTPVDWECLDGTFYIDRLGRPHMVFCHEWVQIEDGEVCDQLLSEDLTTPIGEPKTLWRASDFDGVVTVMPDRRAYVTDGPFFYRCKSGDLVCIWSTYTSQGYAELVSVSDNGDIDGNWTILDTPMSNSDGGHGMIFETLEGEMRFTMHKPNAPATAERPKILPFEEKGCQLILGE